MSDEAKHGDKGEIKRVELPSGNWWEFYVPETYGQVLDYDDAARAIRKENPSDKRFVLWSLIYWTASWSFDLPVSEQSLRAMSIKDSNEAELFWGDTIIPLLNPRVNRMRNLTS